MFHPSVAHWHRLWLGILFIRQILILLRNILDICVLLFSLSVEKHLWGKLQSGCSTSGSLPSLAMCEAQLFCQTLLIHFSCAGDWTQSLVLVGRTLPPSYALNPKLICSWALNMLFRIWEMAPCRKGTCQESMKSCIWILAPT